MSGWCRFCGDGAGARKIDGSNTLRYKGLLYMIAPCEMMACKTCGESYFTPDQAKECTRKLEHQHSRRMLA